MRTDIDRLEHIAALLNTEALALRLAHTADADHQDWTGEDEAKRCFDDMIDSAEWLQSFAARMKPAHNQD